MSRHIRIEYPGAIYHITSRGNARESVYLCDKDRQIFLDILSDTVEDHNLTLHSYCLMDNHYHLLVETPDGNLSRAMRQLNGIYTQRFNWRYKRCGHVFQGRYKSVLVERDSYLLELCRYIALNPVRARIVKLPEDYMWSSHRAVAGLEEPLRCLSLTWILSNFSTDSSNAAAMYQKFVMEGIGKPTVIPENGIAIGGESYLQQIQDMASGSGLEHSRRERYLGRPELGSIFNGIEDTKGRNRAIYKAYVENAYTQREIAAYLGISCVTVSRVIKELRMLNVNS